MSVLTSDHDRDGRQHHKILCLCVWGICKKVHPDVLVNSYKEHMYVFIAGTSTATRTLPTACLKKLKQEADGTQRQYLP